MIKFFSKMTNKKFYDCFVWKLHIFFIRNDFEIKKNVLIESQITKEEGKLK